MVGAFFPITLFPLVNPGSGIRPMIHLWDPDSESTLLIDYGIFSTPKVFVAMEDGEIIGRRLEMDNLLQIIQYINILYGEEKED